MAHRTDRALPLAPHRIQRIAVRPNEDGLAKLAALSKVWRRSYLYRARPPQSLLLAEDALAAMEPQLMAVIGPMSRRALTALVCEEKESP